MTHESADGHHHASIGERFRSADLIGLAHHVPTTQDPIKLNSASLSAIGWVLVSTQRGVIMTGSRITNWRRISQLMLPSPMTIPARRAVVGAESMRMCSTSRLLRRCSERSSAVVAQSTQIDDLGHAGLHGCLREGTGSGSVFLCKVGLAKEWTR